jgi:hypothetical protein
MFTVLLFATFLALLWRYHRTGRSPLWLLPLLMVAWVNLHLGFVVGLALIAGYVLTETSEMVWPGRRKPAYTDPEIDLDHGKSQTEAEARNTKDKECLLR